MDPIACAVLLARKAPPAPAEMAGKAGREPTVMSTAESADMTFGCSLVIKSSDWQALINQSGTWVTVVTASWSSRDVRLGLRRNKKNHILSPGASEGVRAGVVAGVLLGVEPLDENADVIDEDTDSIELMVSERFGVGRSLTVATSDVDFDFCGPFGGTGGASPASLESKFPRLPTIHHSPEGLLCTSISSVFCESISPTIADLPKSFLLAPHGHSLTRTRTAHVTHRNFEAFPIPLILPAMHVLHDQLDLVKAHFGLVAKVMLANLVPVLLRNFSLNTARLDLCQPVIDGEILLGFTKKARGVRPGRKDWLEIKGLNLECIKHYGVGKK